MLTRFADIDLCRSLVVEKGQTQIGRLAAIFVLVQCFCESMLDGGKIGEEPVFDGHAEIDIAEVIGDVVARGQACSRLPPLSKKGTDLARASRTDRRKSCVGVSTQLRLR